MKMIKARYKKTLKFPKGVYLVISCVLLNAMFSFAQASSFQVSNNVAQTSAPQPASAQNDKALLPAADDAQMIHLSTSDAVFYLLLVAGILLLAVLALLLYHSRNQHQLNRSMEKLAQSKQQLDESSDSKDKVLSSRLEFMANISHEIRTPLNGVIGGLQMLKRSLNLQEQEVNSLDIVEVSAYELLHVTEQMLDASALQAGNVELNLSSANIYHGTEALMQGFKATALRKGVDLRYEIDPMLAELYFICDPKAIKDVLTKLLSNAVKFTKQGRVVFTCRIDSIENKYAKVFFSVSDTGPGIPNEFIQSLHDPFFMVDSAHNRDNPGAGLGLNICKQLLRLMNTDLNVYSSPQRGSDFQFNLPLAIVDAPDTVPVSMDTSTEEANGLGTASDDPNRKIMVLVVEDNDINAEVLLSMLAEYPVQALWVKNGEDAVKAIQAHRFDLVFMNLQMPVMDGFKATELVRQSFNAQRLPILAVTASTFATDKASTRRIGMNEHLNKPLSVEVIRDVMRRYLHLNNKVA